MTSLARGDDGRVWVGTNRGVGVFEDGRFRAVGRKLPDLRIKAIAAAPGGALWVATAAGLFFEHGRDDFVAAPGWPPGLGATAVWADERGIVAASQGAVYTQHSGSGATIRRHPSASTPSCAITRARCGPARRATSGRSSKDTNGWRTFRGCSPAAATPAT